MAKELNQLPELLAPAGDWEAMRAAVANGADAVYFGLEQFNARHRAANFKLAELPEVMGFLHGRNVKGFVTFNTLVFSDELEEAERYLVAMARAGVDAVIVQDLGVAKLLQRMCPGERGGMAVHGSTQMTLTEARGIEFVRGLGVKRVVLARELSAAEIGKVRAGTDVQVEVFVHGALCVSYSGQCLTSEAIGGRSANRGQCAQACRLPYELMVDGVKRDLGDKAYLLSPSDLAAYDLIGELTRMGVASFKIEGRLKSAHYVAATCQTYRAAIDATVSDLKFEISETQRHDLEQTFSRGFTHGFLSGVDHQGLVAARFPKARGTRVGVVSGKSLRGVTVKIEPRRHEDTKGLNWVLKAGDGVVFDEGHPEQDEQGGRVFAVRMGNAKRETRNAKDGTRNEGVEIEVEFWGGDVNLAYINLGAIVWKTDDPAVKRRLAHSFSRDGVARRRRLDVRVVGRVGEALAVAAWDEAEHRAEVFGKVLERAEKYPATEGMVREQMGRLGETPFELGELEVELEEGVMIPKSVLNDLRRRVVEGILRQREGGEVVVVEGALEALRNARHETRNAKLETRNTKTEARSTNHETRDTKEGVPSLYVLVRTMGQLEGVLGFEGALRPAMVYVEFEDVRRYAEAVRRCREAGMGVGLATIRIVKPGEEGLLKQILDCGADAVLVRSLGAAAYFRERAPGARLIGDYSLNVANELTAAVFAEGMGGAGVERMVPSYDLNWGQLGAMVRRFDAGRLECVIHQHMPMFHMEHCVFAHTLSKGKDFRDCGRPCERHRVDLADRVGERHALLPDVGCRNTLFNAQAQTAAEYLPRMLEMGLRHFRVELLRESGAEAAGLLERYGRLLMGVEKPVEAMRRLRVLNQLGVTRGTMGHE